MNCKEYLKELTSVCGPSGNEQAVAEKIKEFLKPICDVKTDVMGNVIATLDGDGIHFLLDAHTDQIGFVVTAVDDGGFLKVASCGGVDRRAFLSHRVDVWGKEKVTGVISCQPPHLLSADSYKKCASVDEIAIDVGMTKEEAEKIISIGDRVTFKNFAPELLGDSFSSAALDDRSGVAAVIMAMYQLKENGCKSKVTAVFSTQEEVGIRGAKTASYGVGADEAIAVDVSFALTPDANALECGVMGDGPMIGISPILSKEMYNDFKTVAKEKEIPYQLEVMGSLTGTDCDVISTNCGGIKTALLSIPQRYMHTQVECVNIKDVENTAHLISSYILKKGGENNA